ncbi:hypothetical protein [Erythrobacter sp. YT30]|uniref:hypothetical protein n=1 Tax=Erythrobacter sp. YT30 TaxID=1735012 RepID=UPI00076D2478|nr:hypothetical protein [Erythrobacter sp. YT30]KWV93032.1 hypothetical protein AUC45_02560 [Erythrobacter sp. YT30]
MGKTIMDRAATSTATANAGKHVETMLRAELARGDRALSGVAPVLSHMLASSGHALVNEDVIARLRGMLTDCGRQLFAAANAAASSAGPEAEQAAIDNLAEELAGNGPVLSHYYALAMEGHLAHRLEHRSSLDPVLSPLLQELIASDQDDTADIAMSAMAAQSRFIQSQRRMALPVTELPARLFHMVLESWQTWAGAKGIVDQGGVQSSTIKFRTEYDEASTRLGLLTRLTGTMRKGAIAALELDHAGLALFATALATLTRQPRDLAILACHERQAARLALGLRAAGLDQQTIERQFLLLEPVERLPRQMGEIAPEQAAALLGQSAAWKGG